MSQQPEILIYRGYTIDTTWGDIRVTDEKGWVSKRKYTSIDEAKRRIDLVEGYEPPQK